MNDSATIGARLERAGGVIDACGDGARRGEMVDLAGLDTMIEEICQAIVSLPEGERAPLKPRLVDLIDRLNKLVVTLETQQTAVSEDIRDLSSRHRAASAYGKGAIPPTPPDRGKKP